MLVMYAKLYSTFRVFTSQRIKKILAENFNVWETKIKFEKKDFLQYLALQYPKYHKADHKAFNLLDRKASKKDNEQDNERSLLQPSSYASETMSCHYYNG